MDWGDGVGGSRPVLTYRCQHCTDMTIPSALSFYQLWRRWRRTHGERFGTQCVRHVDESTSILNLAPFPCPPGPASPHPAPLITCDHTHHLYIYMHTDMILPTHFAGKKIAETIDWLWCLELFNELLCGLFEVSSWIQTLPTIYMYYVCVCVCVCIHT